MITLVTIWKWDTTLPLIWTWAQIWIAEKWSHLRGAITLIKMHVQKTKRFSNCQNLKTEISNTPSSEKRSVLHDQCRVRRRNYLCKYEMLPVGKGGGSVNQKTHSSGERGKTHILTLLQADWFIINKYHKLDIFGLSLLRLFLSVSRRPSSLIQFGLWFWVYMMK